MDGDVAGAALFKNDGKMLPLSAEGIKSAAIIGPNGNLSHSMAYYYGTYDVCDDAFPSMIDAVRGHLPAVSFTMIIMKYSGSRLVVHGCFSRCVLNILTETGRFRRCHYWACV